MTTEIATISKALEVPKIRQTAESDINRALAMAISKTFALRGQQLTTDDIVFMARELGSSVIARFPGLTVEEVCIALDKGVKKDFGEYYGLNVVTFLDWIKAYKDSESRRKALDSLHKASLPQQTEPTPEEVVLLNRKRAIDTFIHFKESGELRGWIGYHALTYDYLKASGLITFNEETREKILSQAKEHSEKMIRREFTRGKTESINRIINQRIMTECRDSNSQVQATAKLIGLKMFFSGLVKKGKDLKNLLPE